MPTNLQTYVYPGLPIESTAGFGQVSYALTDQIKIEAGMRYSTDEKSRTGYNTVTNIANWVATGVASFVTTPQNSKVSSTKKTYHAALDWQWSPDNLLYVKYDTGYKAGGFTDNNVYGPETIEAYEIGSKNRFLNNKLELNLAGFWYDYTDQQVSTQTVSPAGAFITVVLNAGAARYYGLEAEAVALLTPVDRLNFYVGYINAKYTDFKIVTGPTSSLQLAGNRPPQAPRWTANVGYQHEWAVWNDTLTGRVQTHLESKSYYTFRNFPADAEPSYHRTDLLLTYEPTGGQWQIQGYVRNLEDKNILAGAQDPSSGTYAAYRYQWQPPRTFGARVTYNW